MSLHNELEAPKKNYPKDINSSFSTKGWNDERTEMCKKLWADGLSASQIAAELGGITRNAVIGKVHRLGLSGRAKSPSAARVTRKSRRTGTGVTRAMRLERGNTALAQAFDYDVESEAELLEIPVEQRKTSEQLGPKDCHWIVGDPQNLRKEDGSAYFCGGKVLEGKTGTGPFSSDIPFCVYHCRIAYQPLADRRHNVRPFRDYVHAN